MTLHTRAEVRLETTEQLKALADPTRAKILRILEDGPASAKQLSEVMGMTHGKVGHHVKVLREAGLIEVVDEVPVRAVTEKFYGLTHARIIMADSAGDRLRFALAQAAIEALPAAQQPFDPPARFLTMRLAPEKAEELQERLADIVREAVDAEDAEGDPFGMVVSVFRTDTPKVGKQ